MLMKKYQIAVLDDYQSVALESADWSLLCDRADIAAFRNILTVPIPLSACCLLTSSVSCVSEPCESFGIAGPRRHSAAHSDARRACLVRERADAAGQGVDISRPRPGLVPGEVLPG